MAKKKSAELQFANEVLEVYQNLGTPVMDQQWSTPSAKYLHTWLRESQKNEEKFFTTMLKSATDLVAKHGLVDVADAVLEIDAKTILELKKCLHKALLEAEGDAKPRPLPKETELDHMKHLLEEPRVNMEELDTELEPEPTLEDLF